MMADEVRKQLASLFGESMGGWPLCMETQALCAALDLRFAALSGRLAARAWEQDE